MTLFDFGATMMASGSVGNPQVGTYIGQCVSMIQQYLYLCFGVDYAPRGNAKDFVPPKFHRVTDGTIQKGDIIRYGSNYGGGYGHIGMIVWSGNYMDQNGVRPLAIGKRSTPFAGIESVWRPNNGIELGGPSGNGIELGRPSGNGSWDTPVIPAGATPENGTFKASVVRNIRRAPNLGGEIVDTFDVGYTQKYDCKVEADGFMWVGWNGASGHRSWTAVRRLSDNKRYGECY